MNIHPYEGNGQLSVKFQYNHITSDKSLKYDNNYANNKHPIKLFSNYT